MRTLIDDLSYASRQLIKHPVFTLSVLLSLALGIGVNTTVFSIANAVLFRAPQAARPGELVRIYVNEHSPFRYEDYRRIKKGLDQVFSHVIAETVEPVSLATAGEPTRAMSAIVSGDYFAALGLQPALGTFPQTEAEGQPSAVPQVVLSHAYWTERYGADPRLIGSTIRINDRAFVVSGVAPSGFTSAQVLWAPDVYVLIGETSVLLGKGPEILGGRLYLTARLANGVSRASANAHVGQQFSQVAAQDSVRLARQSWRVDAAVGLFAELRGRASIAFGFLIAIALAVLLVACFNVGNLLLARNAARTREFTIRLALGASRGRLVRQLLAELALLAALGAGLALLATRWSTALVAGAIPAEAGLRIDTSANLTVIAFTLFLVTVVVGVSGLAPALQASRADLTAGLRDGAPGGSRRRTRLRRIFLGLQVTASTLLVACASLFVHSLSNADRIDAGFDATGILNAPVELSRGRETTAIVTVIEQLMVRVGELPGVAGVTAASVAPLTGNNSATSVYLAGDDAASEKDTYFVSVTPGYFTTMRMPLAEGREFVGTDRAGAPGVAIVNETFAKRMWPGQSALGKRLSVDGPQGPWLEIVGVSRPIRYNSLGETPPIFLYVPFAQQTERNMTLHVVLTPGASPSLISQSITAALRSLDPAAPPPTVRALSTAQRVVLLPAQLGAAFTGVFGGLALLLAALGIFGVAAFEVAQRARELAIRSALGAPRGAILGTVLRDTLRTVLGGGVVGLGLAMALGRVVSSQLYAVSATDPVTVVVTIALLTVVAAVASLVPAQRALGVDPAVALRHE